MPGPVRGAHKPHFSDVETEVQRGQIICLRSHSRYVWKLSSEPRPTNFPLQRQAAGSGGDVPSLRSQPSRSGLKNVWVRSFPSSSGILKGSFRMLS